MIDTPNVFFLRVDKDSYGRYRWRIHGPNGRQEAAAGAGTPTLAGAIAEAQRIAKEHNLLPLNTEEARRDSSS